MRERRGEGRGGAYRQRNTVCLTATCQTENLPAGDVMADHH